MDVKSELRNEIFLEIKYSLLEMKKTKKVDLGILTSLSNLDDLLRNIKTKWLKIKNSNGYYFYRGAISLELALGQMEYRFNNSQKSNDIQIVKDSLNILPAMDNVLEIIQLYEISENLINDVLHKTRVLRNLATETNLIEPLDVTMKDIGMDDVDRMLKALKTSEFKSKTQFKRTSVEDLKIMKEFTIYDSKPKPQNRPSFKKYLCSITHFTNRLIKCTHYIR